jgi:phage portal protein BeeE
MGSICSVIEQGITRRSTTSSPAQWFIDWVRGGAASSSGVAVNHQVALKYSPFWAAVRVISGTLAALPFLVYERLDNGGKQRMQTHPIYFTTGSTNTSTW